VTLQGLDIQGINQATGNTPGTIGVRILRAGRVTIEDSTIEAFAQSGIDFESTSPNAQLTIDNSQIYNNTGAGLFIAPLGTGTSPSAILTNDKVDGNGCGLVASTLGSGAFTNQGCGAGTAAPAGSAKIGSTNTSITNNAGSGVMSDGAGASNTLGRDLITGNGTGLKPLNSGTILSLGQNELYGNGTDGAPTSVSNQEQGPAGQTGAVGPAGQPGPTGARGPAGAAGQIRLVTCKTVTVTVKKKGKKHKVHRQKCTSKLVSGTASFTTARSAKIASATLTRKGQVYATGRARITATGTRVVFNHRSRLAAGSYQLILRRGHKVIARRTFLVR
jgi:hypothetical protein